MTPDLSIGISFKNPGRHFRMALQSVFAQTYENWELILMDDGSSDDSLELARSLRDRRVRVFSDGESRNLNVRLNQLVGLARGKYFVRMDADDAMHPERLERQYERLVKSGPGTVIGSSVYSINSNSEIIGVRPGATRQQTGFAARHSFLHPTVAARIEWFRENPYSERDIYRRCEDAELWCRTSANSEFITIPEPLYYYRELIGSAFPGYVSGKTGILHLLREQYRTPFVSYSVRLTLELAKMWVAFLSEGLDKSAWLDSWRHKKLPVHAMAAAVAGLNLVHAQQLPQLQEIYATAMRLPSASPGPVNQSVVGPIGEPIGEHVT